MATMPERIARLEERQMAHEEEQQQIMANLSVRIDKAHETATEAKELATQVANSMEAMPGKIIEALSKKGKEKRMETKDWVLFVFSALTLLAMFGEKFGWFK